MVGTHCKSSRWESQLQWPVRDDQMVVEFPTENQQRGDEKLFAARSN